SSWAEFRQIDGVRYFVPFCEDRDEHIMIRWANILPGMDSQFDIVSSAIQDTLGEPYDYRSFCYNILFCG
uniref:Astacin domain-containing protein n=1 Tax=Globodera pallida TaxID=36090 RepID=A0A183CU51_GLOPA